MRVVFCKASAVSVAIVLGGAFLATSAIPASADVPCGASCFVSAATGSDANAGQATSPFKTIQAAIDAVAPGGTVNVRPGNYNETASARTPASIAGTYDFGLFVGAGKTGITIQGVTAADAAITSASAAAAHVTTNSTASFGPVGVFVEADGVKIQGLGIGANLTDATGCGTPGACKQNRTVESVGEHFTFNANLVEDFYGSVYLDDPRYDTGLDTPHVTTYAITNNIFRHGVSLDIANGTGGGPNGGAATGRVISGNTIDGDSGAALCPVAAACTANQIFKPAIAFDGAGTSVPAFVEPVGPATMSGNTFGASSENIAHRYGPSDTTGAFPWASYFTGNTFGAATIDTPDGNAANVRSISYGPFPSVDRIGGTLQTAHPSGCIGVDCNGEITNAVTGDVVLVRGTLSEQVVIDRDLTLRGGAGGALTSTTTHSGTGITIPGPGTVTIDHLAVTKYARGIEVSGGVGIITLDTVTGNGVGVDVTGGEAHANLNSINGSSTLDMQSTLPATDGHCNWWGSVFGPAAGKVNANVDYRPYWLISSTLTQANCVPVMSLGTTTISVPEGALGAHTVVNLGVTLTASWPTAVTAHWQTVSGTATSFDNDYTAAQGTVTFPADSTATQTISVTVNGDNKLEDYQSFTVQLSAPVNAGTGTPSQTIQILNDERPQFAAMTNPFITEGATLKFTVKLRQRYNAPVTISASTFDGAALAPGDYTAVSGFTAVIPAGLYGTATIPVVTKKDHLAEFGEDFYVSVSSSQTINTVTAIGTIMKNST
jgi:hypothetical protein